MILPSDYACDNCRHCTGAICHNADQPFIAGDISKRIAPCVHHQLIQQCQFCPDWCMGIGQIRSCMNAESPRYQHGTADGETCEQWGRGTSWRETRAELRQREQLAKGSMA